jgi:hypothetical protein
VRKWQIRVVTLMLVAIGLAGPSSVVAQQIQEDGLRLKEGMHKTTLFDKASRSYLVGGITLDAVSTFRLMDHPTKAYREDGSFLATYHGIETGWARCFGARNKFAAISANVALDAGIDMLSRKIYRRGGRWRILANGLTVLKGTGNMADGIHNMRFDPDRSVRMATGYQGQIIWSH